MKVLVIGNSQAAALREALADVLPPGATGPAFRNGVTFYFYCQVGGGGPNLYVRNGRLVPPRIRQGSFTTIPDGRSEDGVLPSEYDAIVIAGVGLPADRSDPRHVLTTAVCAEYAAAPSELCVSKQFLRRMMEFAHRSSAQWSTILALREIHAGPLLLQASPLPAKPVLERPDFLSSQRYLERTGEFLAWYSCEMRRLIVANAATLSPPADVIAAPVANWYASGFTPVEYASRDPWHMNGRYGALVLDQIVAWTEGVGRSAVSSGDGVAAGDGSTRRTGRGADPVDAARSAHALVRHAPASGE